MTMRQMLLLFALAPFASAAGDGGVSGPAIPKPAPAVTPAPVVTPVASSYAPSPVPAFVSERDPSGARNLARIRFIGENDRGSLFGNDDKYYTNGGVLTYETPVLNSERSVWDFRKHYGIGQELYTPKDRMAKIPPRGDRPYAAWAYGMIGASWDDGESLDVITLRAGIVGPSALGHETQDKMHEVLGVEKLKGWDTQLRDEPGINLEWRRNWRIAVIGRAMDGGFGVDIIPTLYAEVGTVRDSIATGVQIRAGKNLPADYGVHDLRKGGVDGSIASFRSNNFFYPDSYYLFAGADYEYRVWDMTLKGNMYHDGNSVTMYHAVRQYGFGVAMHWGNTKLSFSQNVRSREFLHQEGVFWFGSVSLSHAF